MTTKVWSVGDLIHYKQKDPATTRIFEITKVREETLDVKLALETTVPLWGQHYVSHYVFMDQMEPMNAMVYLARMSAL